MTNADPRETARAAVEALGGMEKARAIFEDLQCYDIGSADDEEVRAIGLYALDCLAAPAPATPARVAELRAIIVGRLEDGGFAEDRDSQTAAALDELCALATPNDVPAPASVEELRQAIFGLSLNGVPIHVDNDALDELCALATPNAALREAAQALSDNSTACTSTPDVVTVPKALMHALDAALAAQPAPAPDQSAEVERLREQIADLKNQCDHWRNQAGEFQSLAFKTASAVGGGTLLQEMPKAVAQMKADLAKLRAAGDGGALREAVVAWGELSKQRDCGTLDSQAVASYRERFGGPAYIDDYNWRKWLVEVVAAAPAAAPAQPDAGALKELERAVEWIEALPGRDVTTTGPEPNSRSTVAYVERSRVCAELRARIRELASRGVAAPAAVTPNDGICPLCSEMTDSLAAHPGSWPLAFAPVGQDADSGKVAMHHAGCVRDYIAMAQRVDSSGRERDAEITELRAKLAEIDELVGEGGDDTTFGRCESLLCELRAHQDEDREAWQVLARWRGSQNGSLAAEINDLVNERADLAAKLAAQPEAPKPPQDVERRIEEWRSECRAARAFPGQNEPKGEVSYIIEESEVEAAVATMRDLAAQLAATKQRDMALAREAQAVVQRDAERVRVEKAEADVARLTGELAALVDYIKLKHNGYDAEARKSMDMVEPATPLDALRELIEEADCMADARLKADVARLTGERDEAQKELREVTIDAHPASLVAGIRQLRKDLAAARADKTALADAARDVAAASTWIHPEHEAIEEWPGVVGNLWRTAVALRNALESPQSAPTQGEPQAAAAPKFDNVLDADRVKWLAAGMGSDEPSEAASKAALEEIAMRLETGGYAVPTVDWEGRRKRGVTAAEQAAAAPKADHLGELRKLIDELADPPVIEGTERELLLKLFERIYSIVDRLEGRAQGDGLG